MSGRTRVGVGCIAVLAAVSVAAQPPANSSSSAAVPWANKLFVPENTPAVIVHDFGTVPKGTVCVHKFKLTNPYDVPLQVIDVRKSCTCLEAYPPQQVIPPNESAEIVLTMNSDRFVGPSAQTFFITFGPQFTSTALVQVKATSRADVTVSPGGINFGTVAQGARAAQAVSVRYTGRQRDWKITGAVPPAGPLDVAVKEAGRGGLLGGGVEYHVAVALKADAPAGAVSEPVTLRTNDPSAPLVQINVAAVVQPPLAVTPGRVRFDGVKVGHPTAQRVMVRAAKPFKVTGVSGDGDGVTVEPFPAAGPVQILTVKFDPQRPGAVRKEVKLTTDLDGGATAVLVVEGEAVQ